MVMNPSGTNKSNRYDEAFGGVKAPLEGCHRNEDMGFIKYFSQRQTHFSSLYRLPYSDENARAVLKERRRRGW
jgi:hypothetical protein